MKGDGKSKVIKDGLRKLLVEQALLQIDEITLTSIHTIAPDQRDVLPFSSAKLFAYAERYCSAGNDCAKPEYPQDCTHFISHCLRAAGVRVSKPSAECPEGLCIRVNDLAASFDTAVQSFSNVTRVTTHNDTRRGDFCFIPSWFGLSKEHVMLLAEKATPSGARVYAHSNNRCGASVDFEGASCAYYRIEDARILTAADRLHEGLLSGVVDDFIPSLEGTTWVHVNFTWQTLSFKRHGVCVIKSGDQVFEVRWSIQKSDVTIHFNDNSNSTWTIVKKTLVRAGNTEYVLQERT